VTVLTGQGSACDLAMNQNRQIQAVDDFRSGKFNLLVATDIAQEGLDVPECNYMIRYEFVSNEIGALQSRGRARARDACTFLITLKST
jgi:ERCC4-related helicase